jgi:hypothetical protein
LRFCECMHCGAVDHKVSKCLHSDKSKLIMCQEKSPQTIFEALEGLPQLAVLTLYAWHLRESIPLLYFAGFPRYYFDKPFFSPTLCALTAAYLELLSGLNKEPRFWLAASAIRELMCSRYLFKGNYIGPRTDEVEAHKEFDEAMQEWDYQNRLRGDKWGSNYAIRHIFSRPRLDDFLSEAKKSPSYDQKVEDQYNELLTASHVCYIFGLFSLASG